MYGYDSDDRMSCYPYSVRNRSVFYTHDDMICLWWFTSLWTKLVRLPVAKTPTEHRLTASAFEGRNTSLVKNPPLCWQVVRTQSEIIELNAKDSDVYRFRFHQKYLLKRKGFWTITSINIYYLLWFTVIIYSLACQWGHDTSPKLSCRLLGFGSHPAAKDPKYRAATWPAILFFCSKSMVC